MKLHPSGFHPKNQHRGNYPFEQLAETNPTLRKFLVPKSKGIGVTLDFSNTEAVRCLNQSILQHFYGIIDWRIPPGYLCPAVPGRIDYLHHLKDLITPLNSQKVVMLDIGTGANGIYALLAASHFDWSGIAVDVNPGALKNVKSILSANPTIESNIELRLQTEGTQILSGVIEPQDRISVTICNPPFYDSETASNLAHQKRHQTHQKRSLPSDPLIRSMQGRSPELIYPGGEVEFVKKLIRESSGFRKQISWFTTLLSKASSLNLLESELTKANVSEIRIIPMKHGNKTTRILAWRYEGVAASIKND